jgi:phosphoglycolate phosphatase-like HAD superfamily hydrolase
MEDAVRFARTLGRVAVLTNKPLRPSEQILEALGIRDLFDFVVGGDGPMPRKPDPSSLNALIHQAGAAPATSMLVGDSQIDHETAVRAGVRCCIVSFGFGYETFPKDRLRPEDRVAADAGALRDVLAAFAGDCQRLNGSS